MSEKLVMYPEKLVQEAADTLLNNQIRGQQIEMFIIKFISHF